MALTPTLNFRESTTTDGTSWQTNSQTPVAAPTIVAVSSSKSTSSSEEPALTGTNGWNVSWTKVGSWYSADCAERLTLFRGTPSSTVAGTLTATFASETFLGFTIEAVSWADSAVEASLLGTPDDGNSSGGNANAVAGITVAGGGAATYLFLTILATSRTFTPEASWTKLGTEEDRGTPGRSTVSFWIGSEDTSPTASWDGAACDFNAVAVEVMAPAGSTDVAVELTTQPRGVERGVARGVAMSMRKINGLWRPRNTGLVIAPAF